MIRRHSSAANRIRIGHDRSMLAGRKGGGAARAVRWSWLAGASACAASHRSHLENLRVAGLDLLARLLHSGRIVLPQVDFAELAGAGLFLHLPVHRVLAGKIDQELLGLAWMQHD